LVSTKIIKILIYLMLLLCYLLLPIIPIHTPPQVQVHAKMKSPDLPRIFLQSQHVNPLLNPALFGNSMFDSIKTMAEDHHHSPILERHCEKCLIQLQELADENGSPFVSLGPSIKQIPSPGVKGVKTSRWHIPLARAREEQLLLSTKCPTVELRERNYYSSNEPYKPFVSLSAVAVVVDSQNRVLLTRRAARMRSFPKAWVMPGGGIDPGESILEGVVREVKEETALDLNPESVEPVAMWESCFPTSGQECIDAGTGVKAHYLVIFCKCNLQSESDDRESMGREVVLQEDETDLAVWLSSEDFRTILNHPLGNVGDHSLDAAAAAVRGGESRVSLEDLCGIYPRGGAGCGIAQGNLFMLEEYFQMRASYSKL
jgi:8-oxo-dGTP pyrophosphatase MutT (NUDIX family)